jgi:hypothetical protein
MTPPPEVLAEMNQEELDLETDVEDIIMLAQGMPQLPPEGLSLKDRLAEIEKSIIEQALTRSQGNVSKTAKLLNLQRTTLIEKINKYDLRSARAVGFWLRAKSLSHVLRKGLISQYDKTGIKKGDPLLKEVAFLIGCLKPQQIRAPKISRC